MAVRPSSSESHPVLNLFGGVLWVIYALYILDKWSVYALYDAPIDAQYINYWTKPIYNKALK